MKAGWENVTLADVCKLINGKAYKQKELLSEGKYKVLRVGNFFTNRSWYYSDLELPDDKYCDDGDLLYAWSASFGPQFWNGGKTIFHYHIWKVAVDENVVDKRFLYYFFDWDKEKIKNEHGAGTTMVHVSMRSMNARILSLPPLEEQKRIVAVLDAAFEGLDRARAHVEANLQNARELFELGITAIFDSHTRKLKTRSLGDLADFRNGLNFTRSSKGKTVQIVGVGDFKDFYWIPEGQLQSVTLDGEILDIDLLFEGDILAVRSNGNRALIGRVMLAKNMSEPTSFSGFTIRIRLNDPNVMPEYMCHFLKTKAMRDLLTEGGGGANISNLNQKLLANLQVKIPTTEIQEMVVSKVEAITKSMNGLQSHYQSKLTDLDDLRQSLLQKAFAGELT